MGKHDHHATERDLLQHLLGDAQPEVRRREQLGVDQRRLGRLSSRVATTSTSPVIASAPRAIKAPTASPALLPHEHAEHDAAHGDDREHRANGVDLSVAGEFDVLHESDSCKDNRDHHRLQEKRGAPRHVRRDGSRREADRPPPRSPPRPQPARTPCAASRLRSCRGSAIASPAAAATHRVRQ